MFVHNISLFYSVDFMCINALGCHASVITQTKTRGLN